MERDNKPEGQETKKGGKGDNLLLFTVLCSGWPSQARKALDAGADPMLRCPDGRTLLHHAAMRGDHEVCSLLLEYGADPLADEKRDIPAGRRPLEFALNAGGKTALVLLKASPSEGLGSHSLSLCESRTLATKVACRMPLNALAEAAKHEPWSDLAAAELAKREARELRKLAAKPKPKASAKAGCRL